MKMKAKVNTFLNQYTSCNKYQQFDVVGTHNQFSQSNASKTDSVCLSNTRITFYVVLS